MKCKYCFEKMELDGEIVAVPVGKGATELHLVLNLNEEAMRILELLQEETSEERIVKSLLMEYAGAEEEIRPLVYAFIDRLRQAGFLQE